MKKLLATAPVFLLLAACANNPFMNNNNSNQMATNQQISNFTCNDNGKVTARYAPDGSAVDLDVTLPKIGLNNQQMILTQVVSGSGARYANTTDPKMSYEWQTKADYGIMSVRMANGQEYSVNCQL
ncbi:MliC family protein [uncultured Psychrobacter sp.]|uniref:MliC family protein n=1 Tax=uncultured Psychrobacter sp. TaxID=259303 RepID=UPI00345B3DCC